ncbi:MAG: putative peptidoglycan binding domain [Eubacteriales bacterium]|nr:putative peptidoglycan binding domain [Eubacteriales bacterium]
MKRAKSLVLISLLTVVLLFAFTGSASAHYAYRFWTAGTGGEVTSTDSESYALWWIQQKAKGWYEDHYGYRLWVVLKDRRINHHDTATNRPGAYWNKYDPYGYTDSIQYTLYHMGYTPDGFAIDNYYGPATKSAVQLFQNYNYLYSDGIVGTYTYEAMAESFILGPWGAR